MEVDDEDTDRGDQLSPAEWCSVVLFSLLSTALGIVVFFLTMLLLFVVNECPSSTS